MLIAGLTIAAVASGLWLTYMIRHPKKWEARIDGFHQGLRPYRLSFDWMRKMEKGIALKMLAVTLSILILSCIARDPEHLRNLARQNAGSSNQKERDTRLR